MKTMTIFFIFLFFSLISFISYADTKSSFSDISCSKSNSKLYCSESFHSNIINYFEDGVFKPIITNIKNISNSFFGITYLYSNTNGIYKSFFSDNNQVILEKDGNYITIVPQSISCDKLKLGKSKNLIFKSSPIVDKNKVLYKNLYPNVNLEFTYFNNQLKEELIIYNQSFVNNLINECESLSNLSFEYEIKAFNKDLDDSGISLGKKVIKEFKKKINNKIYSKDDIHFLDILNQSNFFIPEMTAYDSKKNKSVISINKQISISQDKISLEVKIPLEWLTNLSLVYPIYIDPTIKFSDVNSNIVADVSTSYDVELGHNIMARINISSIPKKQNITDAKYCLVWTAYNNGLAGNNPDVYRINNQTWVESITNGEADKLIATRNNLTSRQWTSTTSGTEGCINITQQVKSDYNDGNNYTTLFIVDPDTSIGTTVTIIDGTSVTFFGDGIVTANSREGATNTPNYNITYTINIPIVNLTSPPTSSDLLFKNRPFTFNFTIKSDFEVINASLWWNYSNIWQQNISNSSLLNWSDINIKNNNLTANLSRGFFVWNVQACNTNGNCDFATNFTIQINNSIPNVASTSINNSQPLDIDDLQCNNGSVSDEDGSIDTDSMTLHYNWTKNGVDQTINNKTLGNTLTSGNDIWICKITPFDGFINGTTKSSSSVSIATTNVAPQINQTNSTPINAELLKGEWLNLSVSFNDTNIDDKHTAHFCKTDSANSDGCSSGTWCTSSLNVTGNFTSCRLNITNLSEFGLQTYTFYTFIVDNTTLISSSSSNTFTIRDITSPLITYVNFSSISITDGTKLNLTINISENVSNLNIIKFNLTNPNNAKIQRLNPTHFTLPTTTNYILNYTIFQTDETSVVGVWNLTYISIIDIQNNLVESYPNLTFEVTSAPGGGSSGGGGGGGGSVILSVINQTNETIIITETCNRNKICEGSFGEDFINCPSDCRFSAKSLTCDDPSVPCIFKNATIARIVMLLLLPISLFMIILPPEQRRRIKDLIFTRRK